MLPPQARFRPNDAEVTAEVFDGEAIILNLATGAYYSTDKAGGLIWTMIAGGHSLEETIAAVLVRYDVSAERARADVERVAGDLVRENLVAIAAPGSVSRLLASGAGWGPPLTVAKWMLLPSPGYVRANYQLTRVWQVPLLYLYRPLRFAGRCLATLVRRGPFAPRSRRPG